MTITSEMPINVEDVDIDVERKSAKMSAKKFQELVEYVDQLESTLKLNDLDLRRERNLVASLVSALATAYTLLNEITGYYGHSDRSRYYDLRSNTIDKIRSQFEAGNLNSQQYEEVMQALNNSASHRNGVAEGGVSG